MGLFRGFGAFFQGMAFVVAKPRLWPRAMVPVATALALWTGLGALGAWAAVRLAHRLADGALAAGALLAGAAEPPQALRTTRKAGTTRLESFRTWGSSCGIRVWTHHTPGRCPL